MLEEISPAPAAASATLRFISLVVALCSSTAVAMVPEISLIWWMTSAMVANGLDRTFGIGLNGGDLAADVSGGRSGLLGEFLDLIGHHGEAFAGLAGASGFNGGVEGEQVGLLRDGADDLDDFADFGAGVAQFGHRGIGDLRGLHSAAGRSSGLMGMGGDVLNR